MTEEMIFHAALERADPAERSAYLNEACAGDAGLRRRVEGLLQAHDTAEGFLEPTPRHAPRSAHEPARAAPTLPDSQDAAERMDLEATRADADEASRSAPGRIPRSIAEGPGTRIGPYKLLEKIAEGGMGVVYLAGQETPVRRRVALKIIKPGMDTEQVVARFEAERQALALMDHPNIAKVLDAGATDAGRPYFVMELVKGVSITDYCDAVRSSPRERLELFLPVCRAIQHAHQKGVIHRDIKPSNVLVTIQDGNPVPKVIDFGVAKATQQPLTERSIFTHFGAIIGTPQYMSPEQAELSAMDVDTRTDVYALGILLYELLTGTTPLERERLREAGYAEILRRIREEDPPKPSTRLTDSRVSLPSIAALRKTEPARLAKLVRGELDWIVMKALEKDRARRYESASAFAADINRYLSDQPLEAGPLSAWYRIRKFVLRNRVALMTTAAVSLALVAGTAVSLWQAARLRAALHITQEHEKAIRLRDQEARKLLYVADIGRTHRLIDAAEAVGARDFLDRHVPAAGAEDLRGFEWYYLRRLTSAHRASWAGHAGREVYHVEYAPDGRTLATAGADGTARVWDVETRQQRLVLRGHDQEVNWVSFDRDGRRLVTAGDDAKVRIWSASDGQVLRVLDGFSAPVVAALFTLDGRDVIAAARDGLHIRWDASTGQRRAARRPGIPQPDDWVETLAISPDGTTAASTGKIGCVLFWDLSQGGLGDVTRPLAFMVTSGECLAFAPDGHTLAATQAHDQHVFSYDVATGKRQFILRGPMDKTFTCAFASDGRTLATGDVRGSLGIWDLETRTCRTTLLGHDERIWCVAFAPDGRTLASTSRDGTIRLWDPTGRADRIVFRGLAHQPYVAESVAFAEGSDRVLAANAGGDVLACDLGTRRTQVVRTGGSPVKTRLAILAPGGATLAKFGLLDPANEESWSVVLHDLTGRHGPIALPVESHSVPPVWSQDGKRLAVFALGGDLTLWDFAGRFLGRADFRFRHGSSAPAFIAPGETVISFCGDSRLPNRPRELVVWEPALSRLERRPAQDVPFWSGRTVLAPDGRSVAIVGDGRELSLRDFPSLAGRRRLIGHSEDPTDLVFAPDGRTVATASRDHTVRLWNVATGQELLTLQGHTGQVRAVAFAPDGRSLASCGDGPDGRIEVIVWRTADGEQAGTVVP